MNVHLEILFIHLNFNPKSKQWVAVHPNLINKMLLKITRQHSYLNIFALASKLTCLSSNKSPWFSHFYESKID